MHAADVSAQQRSKVIADAALRSSARFWFAVAIVGQWIYAFHIASHYGGPAASGNFEAWNRALAHGYVEGETLGNSALAAHLLSAAVFTFVGPLQLMPLFRARFPIFHRWNGRLFVFFAFVLGIAGLYLNLSGRVLIGDATFHFATNLLGVLIIASAAMTWRYALARNFNAHRRWALRLFLLVNSGWFFRIAQMLWLTTHETPVGFDMKTFTGPVVTFLAFAQFLLPLLVLEIYLHVQRSGSSFYRYATAAALVAITLLMGAGVFSATVGMWFPQV